MTKAIISNRIFFKPSSDEQLKEIVKALTYKIEGKLNPRTKTKAIEVIKNYKILPKGILSIPQGRTDLIPEDYVIEDKRVVHEVPFPIAKSPLREEQLVVYNEVDSSCFINALVGWGKTYTALHIAKKLGQKTLVVTHTTTLRDQWIEEVYKLFGIYPGIIGSSQFDIEDHFIVIGNIQSVTKNILKLSKEFGTIILDEAHHVPATTFAALVDGMHSKYRIALSGTMIRSDGRHIVFNDYFGSKVLKPPQSHTLNPKVKLVPTGIYLPKDLPWVKKINHLLYDEDYQQFIAAITQNQINIGHSVLVIAERVEFLTKLKDYLGETCVLITGDTTFEERKERIEQVEQGKKMCIAGSRQIFSEGISVNKLSCVVLAVPTSNVVILEQVIGRIMRLHEGKLPPVVIDIQFSSMIERKQNTARLAFYASKGWEILSV